MGAHQIANMQILAQKKDYAHTVTPKAETTDSVNIRAISGTVCAIEIVYLMRCHSASVFGKRLNDTHTSVEKMSKNLKKNKI